MGRGDTKLIAHDRVVIHKIDGTVSIHGDKGYKPMNYMASNSKFTVGTNINNETEWKFVTDNEELHITFHEIYDEISLDLGDEDPGYSSRNGTENQLQKWVVENLHTLMPEYEFIEREHETGAGKVDILASMGSTWIPIEIKKKAPMTTVSQIQRYVDAIKKREKHNNVVGVIAAIKFNAKTLKLADEYGLRCVEIPATWENSATDDSSIKPTLFTLDSIEKIEDNEK